ncbi:hypothetical protein RBB50_009124 [Rhinocladiella similis]
MAGPDAFKQRYFTEIGPRYGLLTGNTTRDLFTDLLLNVRDLSDTITSDSAVHDNASGPGTATEALISWCYGRRHHEGKCGGGGGGVAARPKAVIATDYVPAMVEAGERIRASRRAENPLWDRVRFKVADSADLRSEFKDGEFTHSICNFSVFNLTHPEKCLREMHRTLAPGGVAAVTCWKRFGASELLSAAQRVVMGDEWERRHRVPVAGPQYFEKGYLAKLVRDAGFEGAGMVETVEVRKTVEEGGEDWDGLYEFLTTSSLSVAATKGWSDDQAARWPEAVKTAMNSEKEQFGGLLFEAWAVIARK